MKNNSHLWWPICLSESVSTDKPIGIRLDDLALAVYRDSNNSVRAVEDRCPHRRAPLSLGRITPEGNIQCGYHGWTFNGETGDICGFPNLEPEERLPRCHIDAYTTLENNGVIYLSTSEQPDELVTVTQQLTEQAAGTISTGSIFQGLSHQETVMAFLDNPNYFLNITGVEFVDKILGNPKQEDGLLVCERAARWNLIGESRFYLGPLRHRADFPLRLQTFTTPITGETLVKIYADEYRLLTEILITFTPAARSMTAIHWRATVFPQAWGLLKPVIQTIALLKQPAVRFNKNIDFAKLAEEIPNAGTAWHALSPSADK